MAGLDRCAVDAEGRRMHGTATRTETPTAEETERTT